MQKYLPFLILGKKEKVKRILKRFTTFTQIVLLVTANDLNWSDQEFQPVFDTRNTCAVILFKHVEAVVKVTKSTAQFKFLLNLIDVKRWEVTNVQKYFYLQNLNSINIQKFKFVQEFKPHVLNSLIIASCFN